MADDDIERRPKRKRSFLEKQAAMWKLRCENLGLRLQIFYYKCLIVCRVSTFRIAAFVMKHLSDDSQRQAKESHVEPQDAIQRAQKCLRDARLMIWALRIRIFIGEWLMRAVFVLCGIYAAIFINAVLKAV